MASSFVGGLSLGPTHVPGPQAGLTMTDLLGTPLASSLAAQQAQALPARPPMAGAALSNPFAGWLGLNAISGGQLLPGASILGLAAPPGPSTYPSLANPLQLGTKTPGDELASERLAVQPAFTPRGDGVEARAQAGSSEVLTRAAEVGKPPSGPSSVRSFAATSHATTGRMPQQGVQGTPKSPHPSSKSKYGFRFQPKELVFLEHIFHERAGKTPKKRECDVIANSFNSGEARLKSGVVIELKQIQNWFLNRRQKALHGSSAERMQLAPKSKYAFRFNSSELIHLEHLYDTMNGKTPKDEECEKTAALFNQWEVRKDSGSVLSIQIRRWFEKRRQADKKKQDARLPEEQDTLFFGLKQMLLNWFPPSAAPQARKGPSAASADQAAGSEPSGDVIGLRINNSTLEFLCATQASDVSSGEWRTLTGDPDAPSKITSFLSAMQKLTGSAEEIGEAEDGGEKEVAPEDLSDEDYPTSDVTE